MTPREFRKQKGWKLAEIARQLGVGGGNPARTYHRWEAGHRPVPVRVVAEIERLSEGKVKAGDWPTEPMIFSDAPGSRPASLGAAAAEVA